MNNWVSALEFNAFVDGKPLNYLRNWESRRAREEAKQSKQFKNCIHKPANVVKAGDKIFINRIGFRKFYSVAHNINISDKSQKIFIRIDDPEQDMCLEFPTVIYRTNTLILTKK